jgi:hypothetical protein
VPQKNVFHKKINKKVNKPNIRNSENWLCDDVQVQVEKILKGSLDSIPSPSTLVKIQIMGGKVCLRCKGKTWLGIVNKLFVLPHYLK